MSFLSIDVLTSLPLHKLSQPLAAASARRRRVTCTLTADCCAAALKNPQVARWVLFIDEAGHVV